MPSNTVTLWHGKLPSSQLAHTIDSAWFDDNERSRASQIKNPLQQHRFLQTRVIIRKILAESVNEKPENLVISIGEHGKPYLANYPDITFNLSHTAEYLLIATAENCRLGVDIEQCKPGIRLQNLARKCLADAEFDYWQQLPEAVQLREFYQFWCAKEAFVKATGRGIALGLDKCIITPETPWHFTLVPALYAPATQWHLLLLDLYPATCAACVCDLDHPLLNVRPLPDF